MKDKRIVDMRNRAERDLSISDGALRLILRLCSEVYCDPNQLPTDRFQLPWTRVATLTGATDKETCYRRIYELLPVPGIKTYGKHRKSYLKRVDGDGVPPATKWFKLNF